MCIYTLGNKCTTSCQKLSCRKISAAGDAVHQSYLQISAQAWLQRTFRAASLCSWLSEPGDRFGLPPLLSSFRNLPPKGLLGAVSQSLLVPKPTEDQEKRFKGRRQWARGQPTAVVSGARESCPTSAATTSAFPAPSSHRAAAGAHHLRPFPHSWRVDTSALPSPSRKWLPQLGHARAIKVCCPACDIVCASSFH